MRRGAKALRRMLRRLGKSKRVRVRRVAFSELVISFNGVRFADVRSISYSPVRGEADEGHSRGRYL